MAMDQQLRRDVRAHLEVLEGVEERSMFGGAGFMWRGNLLVGVMGDELLVRVDKENGDRLIGEDGAHPMIMGGRTSRGWILVPMPPADRPALLARWVVRASSYVATLPAK